jgi:hypothetical protein
MDPYKLVSKGNNVQLHVPKKLETEDGSGSSTTSSVKHIFNFLMEDNGLHTCMHVCSWHQQKKGNCTPVTLGAAEIHNPFPPEQLNKMDRLD